MCNMWSCVFPFCDVQNYHENLGFLSLSSMEKSLKCFEACLLEPCSGRIIPLHQFVGIVPVPSIKLKKLHVKDNNLSCRFFRNSILM